MLERHHSSSQALRDYVREYTGDTVLLSFSTGKDAISSWIALKESGFKRIIPYYYKPIPENLEFIEEGLSYYEQALGTQIHRVTQPSFYRKLKHLVYQPPERWPAIASMDIRVPTRQECVDALRVKLGLPNVYAAIGMRSTDGLNRRLSLQQHGSLNPREKIFQSIYDWKIDDIFAALERSKIKLPVDYHLFGRSCDGLQYTYLKPIREHFPRDYERIKQWFPLVELEFYRRGEL